MLYIDITRLYHNQKRGKHVTGVDRVSLAYVQYFFNKSCALIRVSGKWLFFSQEKSQLLFKQLLANQKITLPSKIFRFYYQKPIRGNNYIIHTGHNGLEDPNFLKSLKNYNLKGIYFLHDLIPIEYPEYCRAGSYAQHQQRLLTMSEGALVICNSNYVANQFLDYCEKNALRKPKTIWAHLGISETIRKNYDVSPILPKMVEMSPFFLVIGTIEGRKNHLLLLNVWYHLIEEFGERCPKLLIVGKRGWECEQVLAILDRSLKLKDYMIELPNCTDSQIHYLLNKTQAVLFPSHTEGFGLPLLEALSLKVPIIASNIPVFQEIGFGVIDMLSSVDGVGWINMIKKYFDVDYRLNKIKQIESIQSQLPTWDEHFQKIKPSIQCLVNKS